MNPATGEEIETLKAIYGDDIEWEIVESGSVVVRVALKGNDVGASWFSASIEFLLGEQYPNEPSKKVSLRHPRGLNETEINSCLTTARRIFDDDRPNDQDELLEPRHLLYDAIESVREYLSKRSGLSLPCPICLHGFMADDSVFVTAECSHHFHTYCLNRYVVHARNDQERERAMYRKWLNEEKTAIIYCPVCRTVIDASTIALSADGENIDEIAPKSWSTPESPSVGPGTPPHLDLSLLSNPIERHFKDMWEKQKRNGGLIDLQREKDRFLVTEHTRLPSSTPSASASSYSQNT